MENESESESILHVMAQLLDSGHSLSRYEELAQDGNEDDPAFYPENSKEEWDARMEAFKGLAAMLEEQEKEEEKENDR